MKLAFIGLGNMGLPMAANLVQAGYEVYGLNRSKGAEERFRERGGKVAGSLSSAAMQADIVMTCLPMPQDVLDVYTGRDGLIAGAREGALLIDFSTVSPDVNRTIAEAAEARGVRFLDAPVSGGTTGAAAGTLSIMVGGRQEDFKEALPVLEKLGSNIYHVGGTGSGTIVKLLNQLMVGIHTQAASEALALGEEMGVQADVLVPILTNSFAQSRILERHYSQFISRSEYAPGFALKLLHKDVGLAQQMASGRSMDIPLGRHVLQLLSEAADTGLAAQDMSAMYLRQKQQGGVTR
ncbi:2-(hydroxymethyl)glutarate dehydrogenase [Paenibacillus konkukensis]|uniref:2-(Hydroxymethyl)glutarate dehydrogenase n=1 Tax=Paenibacillus konkukensis TaxID=2020716 RepID=A0ABY4RWE9_9BACL|nr:NAD(P)-dependent oxidoreductase [Paenibacillus konkukensis]UQZ86155.1 2-(hydroxymethyl)glutarate dehydrogenase [Paenibacillus konkukensis]